jgi:hypothetical protein
MQRFGGSMEYVVDHIDMRHTLYDGLPGRQALFRDPETT